MSRKRKMRGGGSSLNVKAGIAAARGGRKMR